MRIPYCGQTITVTVEYKYPSRGHIVMKRNPFTPEQIKLLEANPYTYRVTEHRLTLTVEAKQEILKMKEEGLPACQIVKKLGYDLDIIGESRAYGLVFGAKAQANSERGLHVGYPKRIGKRLDPERLNKLPTNPETFAKLINEVSYLRQEVDFLKKISQIGTSKKHEE